MDLNSLEQTLIGIIITGGGACIGYFVGMRGKMTMADCQRCQGLVAGDPRGNVVAVWGGVSWLHRVAHIREGQEMSTLTKGCTLISWLAGLLKIVLPEEGCCNDHDLFYEQGGSLRTKIFADWLLAKCVIAINGGWQGWVKAGAGLLVLSLNPYSYFVFFRR